MVRTIEVPGDRLEVQPDAQAPLADSFGKELDDLLALTPPVTEFVDDSREAIYTSDEELQGNNFLEPKP